MTLIRAGVFTDIHWGRQSNSEQHNQDCLTYIRWFIENVKRDGHIDHIIFMGDWYQNRASINVSTLNYSYRGAKELNDLNIPVFVIIGNHDLYHRTSRDVYSTVNFHAFSNFTVITAPTYIENIGSGALLCPYIFQEEYPSILRYLNLETWFGHFEFRGFEVTTYGFRLDTGPNHSDFNGPKYIFSGHFHKRQVEDNIVYIGNAFPMDFGDAGDFHRGMMIYDHSDKQPIFIDWEDCPKYVKIKITELIDDDIKLPIGAKVRCLVNYTLSYTESNALRSLFMKKYQLRDFSLEETSELDSAVTDTESDLLLEEDGTLANVNELVIQMLNGVSADKINNEMLIKIYQDL